MLEIANSGDRLSCDMANVIYHIEPFKHTAHTCIFFSKFYTTAGGDNVLCP